MDERRCQPSRAAVHAFIRDMGWYLPQCHSDTASKEKSAAVYQHVYDCYWGAGQSVFAMVV